MTPPPSHPGLPLPLPEPDPRSAARLRPPAAAATSTPCQTLPSLASPTLPDRLRTVAERLEANNSPCFAAIVREAVAAITAPPAKPTVVPNLQPHPSPASSPAGRSTSALDPPSRAILGLTLANPTAFLPTQAAVKLAYLNLLTPTSVERAADGTFFVSAPEREVEHLATGDRFYLFGSGVTPAEAIDLDWLIVTSVGDGDSPQERLIVLRGSRPRADRVYAVWDKRGSRWVAREIRPIGE